jgi:hypothetical protein
MTMQTNNNDRRQSAAPSPSVQNVQPISQARRTHRERDFGVGYGSSSGYASGKRYTSDWAQPRFRCA